MSGLDRPKSVPKVAWDRLNAQGLRIAELDARLDASIAELYGRIAELERQLAELQEPRK